MTNLNRALVDIHAIRRQVADATEFRGYGPVALSITAVLAVLAGMAQARWIRNPAAHPWRFAALWLAVAVVCAGFNGIRMLALAHRAHAGMANEMVRMAVVQFLPASLIGAILPFVLLRVAPGLTWLLPGLWQLIFSLGVFASCRSLPRPMVVVGTWFLLTGCACITLGEGRALLPVAMAGPFAGGMIFIAGIHFLSAKKDPFHEDNSL